MAARGPILITGCSTGIGKEAAAYLLKAGHSVYATARRPETLEDLASAGARTLALDVTDEASMAAAVAAVESEHGSVGTLINNAGYGVYAPIEEADLDQVRIMFDTNVFGLARMCQLVLPGMRGARAGRIINIGSMGGRFTFPVGGYYHATKYAVESLTDALRVEVRRFGVQVVLMEPGPIRTQFEETVNTSMLDRDPDSPYAELVSTAASVTAGAYENNLTSTGPEPVARAILKAVESRRPKTRYVITPAAHALIATRRYGGDRIWDAVVSRQFRGAL